MRSISGLELRSRWDSSSDPASEEEEAEDRGDDDELDEGPEEELPENKPQNHAKILYRIVKGIKIITEMGKTTTTWKRNESAKYNFDSEYGRCFLSL